MRDVQQEFQILQVPKMRDVYVQFRVLQRTQNEGMRDRIVTHI